MVDSADDPVRAGHSGSPAGRGPSPRHFSLCFQIVNEIVRREEITGESGDMDRFLVRHSHEGGSLPAGSESSYGDV